MKYWLVSGFRMSLHWFWYVIGSYAGILSVSVFDLIRTQIGLFMPYYYDQGAQVCTRLLSNPSKFQCSKHANSYLGTSRP